MSDIIKEMGEMSRIVAFCGLIRNDYLAFIATENNDLEQKVKLSQ